ncbi:PREDICTED: WD and tetratricopeptide repeats protein 1 isoform X2 [Nicrophorus vespilloides]|uniref:WD and tetratricopeptide repeats protein 1 isoform X2 n=1 Tax=Nicrophorus vespilloides TaxID=110193 RepID=A0ABM1NJ41_NICVS|nr:PREDICTED: WD and tetratricopeptide repeats protein 1 isoform X2 [Nicrophorus vespilloides]
MDEMEKPDLLWDTVNVNTNIAKLLAGRELGEDKGTAMQKKFHFTTSLLKRFALESQLEGHQGCVNCLQWSADGRYLASGSDDTNVRIWDPFANRCLHVIPTKHVGNIFSVKFVGDGSMVATGAGDCKVIVQSIENNEKQAIMDCICHAGRVKRLATAPDQPHLFWTAAEDGLILQYDLREQHDCLKCNTVFVNLSEVTELKCITVNPTKPHLIAAGANDSYVRLYDRRMIKTTKCQVRMGVRTSEFQDANCVQYYAPGHLAKDNGGEHSYKLAATYVTFDSTGNDLLVNMGGEHIYLFNINDNRHVNQMSAPDCLPKPKKLPPIKPCCLTKDDNKMKSEHEYNYKIVNKKACACDYICRARRLFLRKWIGDMYFAARDYLHTVQQWPDCEMAYFGLIECLISLKWPEEATNWINHFQAKFPHNSEICNYLQVAVNKLSASPKPSADELSETIEVMEVLTVSDEEKAMRLNSIDFESRYIGHCNTTTDIKEANFMGDDGNFICGGSDDGMIFIWDRKTSNLLTRFEADKSIVNCVQPHPSISCIASSGIDPVVKIWAPKDEDDKNYTNRCKDPWSALRANQDRMKISPFETMLMNMGYNNPHTHEGV